MHYRFDRFDILVEQRQLLVDGAPAAVGGRAFDLLLTLIQHRDRMVSKHELLDAVWPGLVVEENNLQVQMSSLRKLLGPRAIVTIPGRGYRFAGSVGEPKAPGVLEHPGAPPHAAPAAPASLDAPTAQRRTNLSPQLPTLYGRVAEVAEVMALLGKHQAVSILASSGVGKTRLAQAVAAELRDAYDDGVWWVELAPLTDGELVAAEVARVLGFPLPSGRPTLQAVIDVLRPRSLLLLLDNCEHLLAAVAALVGQITRDAPRVRVLVTSQEPLKIAAEQAFRLNTLSLPSASSLDETTASGAVQLFVSRVQAADPRFMLTAANAANVVAICRRLDGIPLALELAAARVPLLGVDRLLALLDERFRILTGGSRFVLRRHQTLRAALDFSHGLLTPDEQAVFRRVSVFTGSFSVESAQDVAAGAGIDPWAVLDHLGALVDKSMVLAEQGEHPRLKLLETGRAYALEKLGDAGETEVLLARHARSMGQLFARDRDEHWHSCDAARAARYVPELDNLRSALSWALAHDAELAVELTGNSGMLWWQLELHPEGARRCEAALACVTVATPALAHGRVWLALAMTLNWSQPRRCRAAAARAAELLRQTDDTASLGMALMVQISRTKAPDAEQLAALEEIERLYRSDAPPMVRAQRANARARVNMSSGRYAQARGHMAEAAALLESAGATLWQLAAQWGVGDNALVMGDVDFAVADLRETSRRRKSIAHANGVYQAMTLGTLATACLFKSDATAAREALAEAAPMIVRYDIGARYAATAALLAAQEGRWSSASQLLGYAECADSIRAVEVREPAQVMAHDRVVQRLADNAAEEDISAWRSAGASLTTEAAYELALATS